MTPGPAAAHGFRTMPAAVTSLVNIAAGAVPRNQGLPLELGWVNEQRVNLSAVERRVATLPGRRTVKKDAQAAWLLKARHALPSGTGGTLGAALEALACKQLGFPGETSLDAVRDEVLSRLLGAPQRLSKEQLGRQLVQAAAGSRGAGLAELRDAADREVADAQDGYARAPAGSRHATRRDVAISRGGRSEQTRRDAFASPPEAGLTHRRGSGS